MNYKAAHTEDYYKAAQNNSGVVAYTDWFLPSIDELQAMYDNLHAFGVGGFLVGSTNYWSSSEFNFDSARTLGFASNSSGTQTKSTSSPPVRACRTFTASASAYALRDVGPAGGLIFYISGTTYYEAAPSDQSTGYEWSNIRNVLVGTGTAIGAGQSNTTAIINQSGHSYSAAQVCTDYSTGSFFNGYYKSTQVDDYYKATQTDDYFKATQVLGASGVFNDYFLPSVDELAALYTNLFLEGVGNLNVFGTGFDYWSSTESDDLNAYWNDDGTSTIGMKSVKHKVRAVRTFTGGSYALRDTGPAGGLIFLIDGSTYYEAAKFDITLYPDDIWNNVLALLGGTGSTVGTGQANTTLMINQSGATFGAAFECNDYSVTGADQVSYYKATITDNFYFKVTLS